MVPGLGFGAKDQFVHGKAWQQMELLSHDILIVGGGGAGLAGGHRDWRREPEPERRCRFKSVPDALAHGLCGGCAAAVIKPNDSLDEHAYDTISGADWMADQDAVEAFVNEAPGEMIQLEHWGCPWSREPDGSVAVRPFGGMKVERTWFAADKTGFHMLHALFQTALKFNNITRYDEWFVTRLLTHDGHCQGVAALELRSGQIRPIAGKAVILCTGGGGRIFPFTTNAAINPATAWHWPTEPAFPSRIRSLSSTTHRPAGNGHPDYEASRGEGGILVNKDGYRYLQDYDLGQPLDVNDPGHPQKRSMELGPRDRLSQAFIKEREKGHTIEGPYGDYVHLDLRHMGEKTIDKKIPFVRELCRNYVGIDPVHELIPVRPVVHYMMGGVHTNTDGETPLADCSQPASVPA